ncbi:protein kinase [Massilia sp. Root133]|uniref:serine/threonine protein kinase n=1 Tax=unclassified Massilia TaxID=2609279 RepID=UPI0006F91891|nr:MULTISPECIES: serine/threonine protein kinase [unclassified Massilia]KQY00026.1 protein kinase [Massilia sp. Root133]KQZ39244.1 protein kinase [Massilia sp. Root1485]
MDNLADTLRQFQSGTLGQAEMFARVDRLLASTPESVSNLLKTLNDAHRRAPLPAEVYGEVERRIAQAIEARQRQRERVSDEETYVQTKPLQPPTQPAGIAGPPGAAVERMKGVGDTLNGRFVLEECVGFGGMGTVYKALDLRKLEASDRHPYIAIKVLNVQFQGHPKSLIALQREARKAQTLAHPNIVAVYDFDRDGPMVYITMEYLQGKSLSQMLRAPDFHVLPFDEAMKIVSGMGRALAYAHERGFVHCDFKPANVILTETGGVKVIDFGIARVFQKAEEDSDVTVFDPGSLGALTPAYASPEMLENREPDPRDDIYALGCITYELLTGRHPFNRLSALQARDAGLRPQRPPGLGHRQWRALRNTLALRRELRTPTVNGFLKEIGARDTRRRQPLLIGAGTALAAAAAALVVFVALRLLLPRHGTAPAAQGPPASVAATPPPAHSPPPAPAPPPTLAAVSTVLAGVPCSALVPAIDGRVVSVQGYLAHSVGPARLKTMLAALPGVTRVELTLHDVDDAKCPLMRVLGRYWVASRTAGVSLRLNPGSGRGGNLAAGDTLMVDVATPDYQSYVSVDYFALDGNVVHLLPNAAARENLAPPRYTATIGSLGNWVIGPPFGTDMLVLVTTSVPLFEGLRPDAEPGPAYLRALDERLAAIARAHGAIGVDFLQITTHARR